MKREKNKFSAKISCTFARISTWTGYTVGLLAVILFTVNKDPKFIELVSISKFFLEAAKITVELEENTNKFNKPPNQE